MLKVSGNQTGYFDEWVRELVGDIDANNQGSVISEINSLILAAEDADPDGYSDAIFAQLKSDILAVAQRYA